MACGFGWELTGSRHVMNGLAGGEAEDAPFSRERRGIGLCGSRDSGGGELLLESLHREQRQLVDGGW